MLDSRVKSVLWRLLLHLFFFFFYKTRVVGVWFIMESAYSFLETAITIQLIYYTLSLFQTTQLRVRARL